VESGDERLLGTEALYTLREYMRGALVGREDLFIKLGRASNLKILSLVWLIQSVTALAAKLALDAGIVYRAVNLPPWVASIDVHYYSDRAMSLQAVASAFVIPLVLGNFLIIRGALASYVARRMGRAIPLSGAVMALSPIMFPDGLRAAAVVLAKRAASGGLEVVYDLSVAAHPRLLQRLAEEAMGMVEEYYAFDLQLTALVSAPFLIWEAFLVYRAFSRSVGLGAEDSAWATAAIMVLQSWLALRYSLSPVMPKYFLDPLNFRFTPPMSGLG